VQSLDIDEVLLYFSVLPFREQLIARLAIFVGMRPDEILALRWKDIADRAAIVDERVYRGVLDTPKNGKTREVGLGSLLADDLCKWFDAAIDQTPEAFVFPSEHGTPMSRDNVWRRYMWPHLKAVGLQRATFQVLRKTNGTIMKDLGIDQKVAADLRGHGLGVSMELYVLSRRKLKVDAVEEMESAVTLNQKLKSA
jgi:integrase